MSFLNNNFISDLLVQLLYGLNSFINHYWLTIILLTIIIRLILIPIDVKQRKSTRIMQELAPEAESLKKRYANNPQVLQQKTNELYKQKGASPFGGCLPMIVMMVLLCAFYGSISVLGTNETLSLMLRIAQNSAADIDLPSFLWINNFWQPDSGMSEILPSVQDFNRLLYSNAHNVTPEALAMLKNQDMITFASSGLMSVNESVYTSLTQAVIEANGLTGRMNGWFLLPVLSGGLLFLTQFYSMKKNPQQMEQMKTMLYFFPLFSVYICIISNSAFAIYWIASSLYSLVQTIITDKILSKKSFVKKEASAIK